MIKKDKTFKRKKRHLYLSPLPSSLLLRKSAFCCAPVDDRPFIIRTVNQGSRDFVSQQRILINGSVIFQNAGILIDNGDFPCRVRYLFRRVLTDEMKKQDGQQDDRDDGADDFQRAFL